MFIFCIIVDFDSTEYTNWNITANSIETFHLQFGDSHEQGKELLGG